MGFAGEGHRPRLGCEHTPGSGRLGWARAPNAPCGWARPSVGAVCGRRAALRGRCGGPHTPGNGPMWKPRRMCGREEVRLHCRCTPLTLASEYTKPTCAARFNQHPSFGARRAVVCVSQVPVGAWAAGSSEHTHAHAFPWAWAANRPHQGQQTGPGNSPSGTPALSRVSHAQLPLADASTCSGWQ